MAQQISFMDRLKLAWRLLVHSDFAAVQKALDALEAKPAQAEVPHQRVHASGLMLLSALQREGRFVDFLRQDIAAFSEEDVGAAARIVHDGCAKVLKQFFEFEPAIKGEEGTPMSVPPGFDAERIRLTGNLTGQPPFRGTLKHHGWVVTAVRMPAIPESLDPRVVSPAEVELP